MSLKTLHVFNPEHDIAMAVDSLPYTPPAEVEKIKKSHSLLPALYADNGDFILIPSEIADEELNRLPFHDLIHPKKLKLIKKESLEEIISEIGEVKPWGWDIHVCAILSNSGLPPRFLPSIDRLQKIRKLSHRATTIPLRKSIARHSGDKTVDRPVSELCTLKEVEQFVANNPLCFLKAPWSSSGRGLIKSDHISHKGLMEWAHGVIKKQGSVIAEPAWDRVIDFATEWEIKNGKAVFIGLSVFKTSDRGKYHGNVDASQDDLLTMIKDKAPSFGPQLIEAQKKALEEVVAPHYSGPLGIDMLADSDGRINNCVEINLRLTMGYIRIIK